ncbi:MAG: hypothetical protein UV78_C0051G0002 [Parcubacteria group bacterium GW2011_GWA2_43_17]|nr:MAG: hypothetical protein UV78_C0051G0002 [Parcubacteria group bacterium GW2011_GWA2_43_17]HBG78949.1 hypothetical protein [Phycisphaerales bacterium]HBR20476.1 hypothetical protein [Phycisphaerales bacterium]
MQIDTVFSQNRIKTCKNLMIFAQNRSKVVQNLIFFEEILQNLQFTCAFGRKSSKTRKRFSIKRRINLYHFLRSDI